MTSTSAMPKLVYLKMAHFVTVKCNVSAQLTREEDRVCSLTASYE